MISPSSMSLNGAEVDARLVAFLDGGDVVLEATQRGDLEVVDGGDAVAQDTALRTALDFAVLHHDAGDVAELGGAEDLADLGVEGDDLFVIPA